MRTRIVTDSSSCISQSNAKELGIDVIPLNISISGKTYIDGVDIDSNTLCSLIDNGKDFPKTSQPSPESFIKIFESAKEHDEAVLCILMSSKISGTFQCAVLAKSIAGYKNVRIVDSSQFVGGLEILVDEAYRLKDVLELDDLVRHLEEFKSRIHIYAVVDTLTYLQRGGRLSKIQAIIGNILSFKPIVYFPNGRGGVKGTYRGRKNAYKALFDILDENKIDLAYPVYFGYSKDDEHLKEIEKLFYEKYGRQQCVVTPLSAGMISHVGPGAAAIYYVEQGKEKVKKNIVLELRKILSLTTALFAKSNS